MQNDYEADERSEQLKENENKKNQIEFIECIHCKQQTRHRILSSFNRVGYYGEVNINYDYEIIECLGCGNISIRESGIISEDMEVKTNLYPQREEKTISSMVEFDFIQDSLSYIPDDIRKVYLETSEAIKNNMPNLASVGIRALVEAILNNKGIKKNNLKQKIEEAENQKIITPDAKNIIDRLRGLGNDSAHQLKAPTKFELYAAIKVLNYLLNGIYILPKEADILDKKTKP